MHLCISRYVALSLIGIALTRHIGFAYKVKLNTRNTVTEQSTTYESYGADRAVDGNTDGDFSKGSCTRTRNEERAWWKVKLGHLHAVDSIKISNSLELIHFMRLWKLNITVGNNSDFTQNALCAYFRGPVPRGGTWRINCRTRLYGRYITIQKTTSDIVIYGETQENEGILTLCEVQVFGHIILPEFPGVPSSYPVSASSIQLMWQLIQTKKDENLQLSHHFVQYRLNESGSNWENKPTEALLPQKLVSNVTVTGLERNQRYLFRVIPVYTFEGDDVQGEPSLPVGVKTKCLAPLAPRILLTRADCDHTGKTHTLILIWKGLNEDHRCNSYSKLEVLYTTVGSVSTDGQLYIEHGNPDISNLIINVTKPVRAEFLVAVRVHNDVQLVNISNSVVVTSCKGCQPTDTRHTGLAYKVKLNPRNTEQSSTFGSYGADKAVDGNTDGDFSKGSCTRTQNDKRAWWKVKLGHLHTVDSIKITNSGEPVNFRRLWKLNVTVGNNSDFTQNLPCAYFGGPIPRGGSWTIRCANKISGTYIAIQRTTSDIFVDGRKKENEGILTLCEVQVFGHIILPKFPGMPSAYPVSSSAIQLMWRLVQIKKGANLKLNHHLIQYRPKQTTPSWENKTTVALPAIGRRSNVTVKGLDRNKRYLFRVVPVFTFEGDHIQGEPSPPVEVKTKCLAPLAPSIILMRPDCDESGKTQTLIVIWKELKDDHRCNHYSKLEVLYYTEESVSNGRQFIESGDPNINNLIINVSNPVRTEFHVAVRVHNDVELVNISNSVVVGSCKHCLVPDTRHTGLALKLNSKNAEQSSTYGSYGADRAVDGNTDGDFSKGSCTRTRNEARAWWQVKLPHLHEVDSIEIFNSLETFNFRRLWKLNVTVGNNSDFTQNSLCGYFRGPVPRGGTWRINCAPRLAGTYITIQKTTSDIVVHGQTQPNQGVLTLCEVRVFGHIILPQFPGVPSAHPVSSSSIQLMWKLIHTRKGANLQLSHQLVQFRRKQTSSIWENKTTVAVPVRERMANITLTGLDRNQRYLFRVIPVFTYEGDYIQGEPTPLVRAKTKCLAPLAPSIIWVQPDCDYSGKTLTLIVIWKELNEDHRCNGYSKLEVLYSPGGSLSTNGQQYVENGDPKISNLIINITNPVRAEYRITVRVINDVQLVNISRSATVGSCKDNLLIDTILLGLIGAAGGLLSVLLMILVVYCVCYSTCTCQRQQKEMSYVM